MLQACLPKLRVEILNECNVSFAKFPLFLYIKFQLGTVLSWNLLVKWRLIMLYIFALFLLLNCTVSHTADDSDDLALSRTISNLSDDRTIQERGTIRFSSGPRTVSVVRENEPSSGDYPSSVSLPRTTLPTEHTLSELQSLGFFRALTTPITQETRSSKK